MTASAEVDVLIVGSGPIGAAFARIVQEADPSLTVLLVDRGPALTPVPGANLKNYLPDGALAGPRGTAEADLIPRMPAATLARAGTELFDPAGPRPGHMPAAAVSTNVGGMGAHWSCATPQPAADERSPFIGDAEYDELLARAGELLNSSTLAFGASARGAAMTEVLGESFSGLLERPVQPMPHACEPRPGGLLSWTGSDTVLGPLATEPPPTFELRSEVACTRVLLDGDRVVGAQLQDTKTGNTTTISARAVVVAADSLRTPQLLWASGVRPDALGRHLNEHSMVGATVVLHDDVLARAGARDPQRAADGFAADEPAAIWVPYAPRHRFSGQIENSPGSPAGFAVDGIEAVDPARVVSLTWFCPKEPRPEDRITFLDEVGPDGLPLPLIDYSLSAEDEAVVAEAIEFTTRAGAAIGTFVPGQEPSLLADGQSLHYMGTTRMGATDDGTSVCDPYSRVWGVRGLYVGGNGVIAPATACNPTLTSVALAVRAARQLVQELDHDRRQTVSGSNSRCPCVSR